MNLMFWTLPRLYRGQMISNPENTDIDNEWKFNFHPCSLEKLVPPLLRWRINMPNKVAHSGKSNNIV
jgi:hypothetical protein